MGNWKCIQSGDLHCIQKLVLLPSIMDSHAAWALILVYTHMQHQDLISQKTEGVCLTNHVESAVELFYFIQTCVYPKKCCYKKQFGGCPILFVFQGWNTWWQLLLQQKYYLLKTMSSEGVLVKAGILPVHPCCLNEDKNSAMWIKDEGSALSRWRTGDKCCNRIRLKMEFYAKGPSKKVAIRKVIQA